MTTTAAEPMWPEIADTNKVLPAAYREQFLAAVEKCRWIEVPDEGPMRLPFSPGESLKAVIAEFDIKPVMALTHSEAWEAHDTTGKPGYHGDYTCTYQVLGVRTRKQSIYFLDGGCSVTPVLITSYDGS